MNNKLENSIGFILVLLILIFGGAVLGTQMLYFRLLAGIGLGYALTRGFMGFAGSVNRAYRTGSSKLMRILMAMFLGTAAISVAFLYGKDPTEFNLWVNPINFGLILGGIFFGFGMTFSSCCASGVLTDLVTGLPRALTTLVFFALGVFIGFPVQKTASWVTDSWFSSVTGEQLAGGVFLPDWFMWDGMSGYLGAVLLTALFAGAVALIAKKYEDKQKSSGKFSGVGSELNQEKELAKKPENLKLFSREMYEVIFVKPWQMSTGAIVIGGIFALLMGITKAGWGASTVYGFWFGKVLMLIGVSNPESLAAFTHYPASFFETGVLAHPVSVQNIGIILGTLIYLLLAGAFKPTFTEELKVKPVNLLFFAMGGLFMGFGTRLANGCNVGALYTPIANFSLSGWIFLAALTAGGILGNMIGRMTKASCVN
ncbi:MAG: YeeE/YedE family protein [Spirochaetales bacterium]|nr:YeeE/YedE family protein [Spirochaetales bacterium]